MLRAGRSHGPSWWWQVAVAKPAAWLTGAGIGVASAQVGSAVQAETRERSGTDAYAYAGGYQLEVAPSLPPPSPRT